MAKDLSNDARNLIQTIDTQLAQIVDVYIHAGDKDHALVLYREELQNYKNAILSDPAQASLKRPREGEDDDWIISVRAPKLPRRTPEQECCTCWESFQSKDLVRLRCCNTRYCKACFCEWASNAINGKHFPKCCDKYIKPEDYPRFLVGDAKKKYKNLQAEFDAEHKVFCSNDSCGVLIKVSFLYILLLFPSLTDVRLMKLRVTLFNAPNVDARHVRLAS